MENPINTEDLFDTKGCMAALDSLTANLREKVSSVAPTQNGAKGETQCEEPQVVREPTTEKTY